MKHIQKTIEIDASAKQVWDVLTQDALVRQWAAAFYEGTWVDTDWQVGSVMAWKAWDEIGAKGIIEIMEPQHHLKVRFWDDVNADTTAPLGKYVEDYRLEEKNGKILLHVDFGPLSEGDYDAQLPLWEKAAVIIKSVAEN